MKIVKPMADIEADFKAAVRTSNSPLEVKETAVAELRGSFGHTREQALTLIAQWVMELGVEKVGAKKTREVMRAAYDKATAIAG